MSVYVLFVILVIIVKSIINWYNHFYGHIIILAFMCYLHKCLKDENTELKNEIQTLKDYVMIMEEDVRNDILHVKNEIVTVKYDHDHDL